MQLNQLFPTPVGFFTFDGGLSAAEQDFILQQNQRANTGNTSSEDNYIMRNSELHRLQDFFVDSANTYFKEIYQPATDVKLRITQSWANYTQPGQFHHKHSHPNSVVSGVFYVQTNPGLDRIYFYRSGYQQIKFKTENWNLFNSESWWFEAIQGQLIMFPSHLEHMVQSVNEDKVTRISLSFNTFPVGTVGDYLELTELML
jgi:uncharacterized protein (TIGR02466 family)